MNQSVFASGAQTRRGLHPLIAAAAVSVIVLCAVGVAALLGWLPTPWADPAAPETPTPAQLAAPAAAPTVAPPAKVAATTQAAPKPAPAAQPATCHGCGVVESVRPIQVPVKNSGHNVVGTVAGGVVGGVVGNQFGGGRGKDALTVLGALGGALAGHEIERNIRQQQTVTHYEMTVRMNDGSTRNFHSSQPFAYASGDHVRVENGQVLPR